MLFFSKGLDTFSKGFAILFNISDIEDDNEDQGQKEKGRIEENENKITDADKNYFILNLIKEYSDFTHIDFDRTWDKGIVEFLNTIAFIKEYKRREMEQIKKQNKGIMRGSYTN